MILYLSYKIKMKMSFFATDKSRIVLLAVVIAVLTSGIFAMLFQSQIADFVTSLTNLGKTEKKAPNSREWRRVSMSLSSVSPEEGAEVEPGQSVTYEIQVSYNNLWARQPLDGLKFEAVLPYQNSDAREITSEVGTIVQTQGSLIIEQITIDPNVTYNIKFQVPISEEGQRNCPALPLNVEGDLFCTQYILSPPSVNTNMLSKIGSVYHERLIDQYSWEDISISTEAAPAGDQNDNQNYTGEYVNEGETIRYVNRINNKGTEYANGIDFTATPPFAPVGQSDQVFSDIEVVSGGSGAEPEYTVEDGVLSVKGIEIPGDSEASVSYEVAVKSKGAQKKCQSGGPAQTDRICNLSSASSAEFPGQDKTLRTDHMFESVDNWENVSLSTSAEPAGDSDGDTSYSGDYIEEGEIIHYVSTMQNSSSDFLEGMNFSAEAPFEASQGEEVFQNVEAESDESGSEVEVSVNGGNLMVEGIDLLPEATASVSYDIVVKNREAPRKCVATSDDRICNLSTFVSDEYPEEDKSVRMEHEYTSQEPQTDGWENIQLSMKTVPGKGRAVDVGGYIDYSITIYNQNQDDSGPMDVRLAMTLPFTAVLKDLNGFDGNVSYTGNVVTLEPIAVNELDSKTISFSIIASSATGSADICREVVVPAGTEKPFCTIATLEEYVASGTAGGEKTADTYHVWGSEEPSEEDDSSNDSRGRSASVTDEESASGSTAGEEGPSAGTGTEAVGIGETGTSGRKNGADTGTTDASVETGVSSSVMLVIVYSVMAVIGASLVFFVARKKV